MFQQALGGGYSQQGGYMEGGDLGGIASSAIGDLLKIKSGLYRATNRMRRNKNGETSNYIALVPRPDLTPLEIDQAMMGYPTQASARDIPRARHTKRDRAAMRNQYADLGGPDGLIQRSNISAAMSRKYANAALRAHLYTKSDKYKAYQAKVSARRREAGRPGAEAAHLAAYNRRVARQGLWPEYMDAPAAYRAVNYDAYGREANLARLARGRNTYLENIRRTGRKYGSQAVRGYYASRQGPSAAAEMPPPLEGRRQAPIDLSMDGT